MHNPRAAHSRRLLGLCAVVRSDSLKRTLKQVPDSVLLAKFYIPYIIKNRK